MTELVLQHDGESLLEVRDVEKYFAITRGVVMTKTLGWVKAVDGISFSVPRGMTFSLVGESGCGKTTTARLILRMERPTAGNIYYAGRDVHSLEGTELRNFRNAVQVVLQNPYSSLNPRSRVGDIIAEPLVVNRALAKEVIHDRVKDLLDLMGLGVSSAPLYPHQFSGGQRQRIAIARALASHPEFIVLDEGVASLDMSIRAQILNLLRDLQERFNLTYLMIAHDLKAVRYMSDAVGVMYLGRIVELAAASDVFDNPLHPYTKALLANAFPSQGEMSGPEMILEGEVPSAIDLPSGCRFRTRCPMAMPICQDEEPVLREVEPQHWVECHLY